ncbi:MAG: ABC transporter permease [Bacteroidetes bacterium]|nr:ABC transporter permease [Bacteroidota bacterium]MCY4204236.1 ABC transporter permease [Bacteroidota bacterium]
MTRKSLVIMRGEFMRRATSKTFILTTLLAPVLLIGFFAIIGFAATYMIEDIPGERAELDDVPRRVAIVDETDVLGDRIMNQDVGRYVFVKSEDNSAHDDVLSGALDAYVHISDESISGVSQPVLYVRRGGRLVDQEELAGIIEKSLQDHLLSQHNMTISAEVRAILDRSVWLDTVRLSNPEEEDRSSYSYAVLGGVLGMIMYMALIIYGSLIMYGTIEERTTRVVEVIISSVSPFDLLMGKVLGVGLVGLVQMTIWIMMMFGGLILAGPIIGMLMDPGMYDLSTTVNNQDILSVANISLPHISGALVIWYILYFIAGYLFYGGLFATVGALVDSPEEAQTLLLPLITPLIIQVIFLSPIILNPDSGIALGLSLFPMTSPVPMTLRLAVGDVPIWQLLLSYGLLVFSFLGSIWISARIYRANILTYGKKASLKKIFGYFINS